jgi:pimeloyl-ACP methyl ester carboxylesterase
MDKKIIEFENLHVAFTEANSGAKKTILFIHGNSGSANSWTDQLNDLIFSEYHLVALDLPGHGDSSASLRPEEDYSIPGMGKVMADSIVKMNLTTPYILVGFSLGSNVVTEMVPYLKPSGIVLVSSSVIGGDYTLQEAFQEGLDGAVFFADGADHESIAKAIQKAFFNNHKNTGEVLINDYKATKPGFRPTMLKTYLEGKISNEIRLLHDAKIPVLVVFGKDEMMANPDYLDDQPFETWQNKVFKIPEAGHYVQMDQPDKFNALLVEYVQERFKGS